MVATSCLRLNGRRHGGLKWLGDGKDMPIAVERTVQSASLY
jgi:hypothetical protein